MASENGLPVVDLSPFFAGDGDEGAAAARSRVMEAVIEACQTYGFFRVVNHGVPRELLSRSLEMSAAFFALPDEEKAKVRPRPAEATPLPAGYYRLPSHSPDKNEYLLTLQPHLGHNLYPADPPEFRQALEECHAKLAQLGLLIQEVLTEGMGLPPGFLRGYTGGDRSFHFLLALHFFPAPTEAAGSTSGLSKHEDGQALTLLFQDNVGGLEVLKDGEWLPAEPDEGSIIVNIGDVIQVLTNKKLKSATHRVVSRPGRHRHSFAYFVNVDSDKWIQPLPEFTDKLGEPPRYRGFPFGEYQQLRLRNKTHPPAMPDEFYNINHYAI